MKAVRIHGFGPPEVLTYEDVARPEASKGEAAASDDLCHGSDLPTSGLTWGFIITLLWFLLARPKSTRPLPAGA